MNSASLAAGICDVPLTFCHSIRFPVQIAGRLFGCLPRPSDVPLVNKGPYTPISKEDAYQQQYIQWDVCLDPALTRKLSGGAVVKPIQSLQPHGMQRTKVPTLVPSPQMHRGGAGPFLLYTLRPINSPTCRVGILQAWVTVSTCVPRSASAHRFEPKPCRALHLKQEKPWNT